MPPTSKPLHVQETASKIEKVKEIDPSPNGPESLAVLKQIQDIMGEYQLESNVPFHHDYWILLGKYRVLKSEGK